MITDVAKLSISPGNKGEDCIGNGNYIDEKGNMIEYCCDECEFLLCCVVDNPHCEICKNMNCPRKNNKY
ncbi:MAG: hypothetical protein IJ389_03835 [Clostridia bacterium]|nr:hypothetical protein [Clostridia bacterium]